MRRSNIGSSHNSPLRVIPERGKITKDSVKSSSNEHWAVLHEDVAGSYFANQPRHVLPHTASLTVESVPFSSDADVLAWKAARNNVNNSLPRPAVKGLNVIPNRERREKPVILSSAQYACGVWLPLDGADSSPSEKFPPKYSSTSAREKSQLIHLSVLSFSESKKPGPSAPAFLLLVVRTSHRQMPPPPRP
jgi:hypothetical protein